MTWYCMWNTLKIPPPKLLELINEFSKVAGYKINIQKSTVSIHDSEWSEEEVKKTTPFAIASKSIKYLALNLTKEVKDLYSPNCKTLKSTQINERICLAHGLGINIVKISILTKAICTFKANPNQNTNGILLITRTNNPELCMKSQKLQIAKAIWRKNKVGGYHAFWFQTILKAVVIKRAW